MVANAKAPVIIKRKKIIKGGVHRGGAWKVAYADFVTAMMAFFMLLWMLNATTEQQRAGIADFFSPTIPISRISGGGEGMFGGTSILKEDTLSAEGTGASSQKSGREAADAEKAAQELAIAAEIAAFQELEATLLGRGGESILSEEALRHVITRLTDDGLIVEIFAIEDAPIFGAEDALPTPVMRDLIEMMARVFGVVANPVAVGGHVPSRPIVVLNSPVWNLSTDRATAVREMLERGGLDPARLRRVTGHADRTLAASDPMAVRNDRIEITLLRTVY